MLCLRMAIKKIKRKVVSSVAGETLAMIDTIGYLMYTKHSHPVIAISLILVCMYGKNGPPKKFWSKKCWVQTKFLVKKFVGPTQYRFVFHPCTFKTPFRQFPDTFQTASRHFPHTFPKITRHLPKSLSI